MYSSSKNIRRYCSTFLSRFSSPKVYALRSKVGGAGLLGRPIKHIGFPRYLEAHETGGLHQRFKLCFQQSTGDSTSPEFDYFLSGLGHLHLHQNVGNLYPPARLQRPVHLPQ